MPEITDNQVDYVPDSAKEGDSKGPWNSCHNCFHKDLCYWYTQAFTLAGQMKMESPTEFPFDPAIIGTKCKSFITKGGVKQEFEKTHDPSDTEADGS